MATTRGRGTQEQVTNFEVKTAVIEGHAKLRPGMSATVDIATETRSDVLYLPIQCVTARAAKKDSAAASSSTLPPSASGEGKTDMQEVIFVVEGDTVRMAKVETGISNDTSIEIISGVREDEKVVSGNYRALSSQLQAGSRVKVKKDLGYRKTSD